MDGIRPGITDLTRNASHVGVSGNYGKEGQAKKTEEEPKDQVTLQGLRYSNKDLNASGKLGVIIKASDPEKLEQMKQKLLENPNNNIKADLPLIGGFAAEIDPGSQMGVMPQLDASTKDIRVFLDEQVHFIEPVDKKDNEVSALMDVAGKTLNVDKAWAAGYKGKGITICVIDTGIAQHPDMKERIIGFKDFVNKKEEAYDDQGHGTHCAGIAAGDGKSSSGKYSGVAPEASLVGVKVLNSSGSGAFSDVISGIQWAVENKDKFGINVISMSLGGYASQSYKDDPVAQAVEAAVDKGIITCVAAGNSGPSGKTIGTPGTAPHVLTVGALDDKGTLDRSDDGVAYFSSRGPSVDGLVKPDVLTPGVNITAPKNTGGYTTMSGTSMANPFAAGLTALLKQAAPTLSPGEVKGVIMGTADKLPKGSAFDQGAGVFDIVEALEKVTGKPLEQPVPQKP
ncbi:MAG: S8 family peptidase [Firmicutes bacterium]|nr:S8 family peptidase [Bacillota bacterium]